MELDLNKLIILLPFAFALHNLEEMLGMRKWKAPIFPLAAVTTRQFGIAATLFTILGFLITFSKGLYETERYYLLVITGFAGMLLLNVFIPHLFAALYYRKYVPGLFTALGINLPLTTAILVLVSDANLLSQKEMVTCVIAGGLVGIFLAFILLKMGAIWIKESGAR